MPGCHDLELDPCADLYFSWRVAGVVRVQNQERCRRRLIAGRVPEVRPVGRVEEIDEGFHFPAVREREVIPDARIRSLLYLSTVYGFVPLPV